MRRLNRRLQRARTHDGKGRRASPGAHLAFREASRIRRERKCTSNSRQTLQTLCAGAGLRVGRIPPRLPLRIEGRTHSSTSGPLLNAQPIFFLSLTPGPPPFSGMNSTPAFSRALAIAPIVFSCADNSPGCVSSRLMLGKDTPDASAKSFCSHRSNILAARTCSLVRFTILIPQVLTSACIEFNTSGIAR